MTGDLPYPQLLLSTPPIFMDYFNLPYYPLTYQDIARLKPYNDFFRVQTITLSPFKPKDPDNFLDTSG